MPALVEHVFSSASSSTNLHLTPNVFILYKRVMESTINPEETPNQMPFAAVTFFKNLDTSKMPTPTARQYNTLVIAAKHLHPVLLDIAVASLNDESVDQKIVDKAVDRVMRGFALNQDQAKKDVKVFVDHCIAEAKDLNAHSAKRLEAVKAWEASASRGHAKG